MLEIIIGVASLVITGLIGGIYKLTLNHLSHHTRDLEPTVYRTEAKVNILLTHYGLEYKEEEEG